MGFLRASMDLPWASVDLSRDSIGIHGLPVDLCGFPCVSHGSTMSRPLAPHGPPVGLPSVSHLSPMSVPSVSAGLPLVCHRSPLGLPWFSHQSAMGFRGPPMGLPWVFRISSRGKPMGCPWENPWEIQRSRHSSREILQNSIDCWMYGCACFSFLRSSPEKPYTDFTIPRKTHAKGRRAPNFSFRGCSCLRTPYPPTHL